MTPTLKTYQNRCRCCLETFEDDEKPQPITDFFELQYFAFTKVELKSHELLSKYVCEYCHLELVRFSVWKKELIEKQQSLYKLLNKHTHNENLENLSDGEIGSNEESDYTITENLSSDELNNKSEHNESSEDEPDDAQFASEHEPDSDFELSTHYKRREIKGFIASPDTSPKKTDLRCGVCGMEFLARQGLVRHESFCRPNKIAGRKFSNKKLKNANKEAKYRCFCNERFTSFRALNIHRTRKHGKHTNMSWDIVDNNKGEKNATSISNNSKLSEATKTKSPTKKGDPFLKCNRCPYKTDSKKILKYHIRANHDDDNSNILSKLECEECFKLFSTTTALRMHVLTVHHDVRPHACLYCKSSFKQLVHLKEHMLAIHKTLHKPYCCACGVSFSTLVALKQHKMNDHKEEDEGDIGKRSLKELQPVKLSGKYICVCEREYPFPSRLNEHQKWCRVYKNQLSEVAISSRKSDVNILSKKSHKCFKCGRGFIHKSNLIRHQKAAGHLDLEMRTSLKFSCEQCKQKFFSLNGLRKHQSRNSCNING